MVEVSLTQFAAAVSTIIVVTMATLFFCCWRKKGSPDIVGSKFSPTREDNKKERSVSPAPVVVERVGNGQLAENTGTPTLLVTNEDLGDFSAVQRETEILRSYRKPPPPKNRARQSRAPRHLKNGRESADIFTELIEEDIKRELCSDEKDEPDSGVLRPRSEGKERPTREARSSMLMEIEQTLAALHTSVPSGESLTSENKSSHTDVTQIMTKETQDETLHIQTADFRISSSKSCTLETLSPAEVKAEAVAYITSSPKLDHIVTPKKGPKVSPKPSPRASARMSSLNVNATTGNELERKTNSLSLSQTIDISSDDAVNTLPSFLHTEVETKASGIVQESPSSGLETPHKCTYETSTSNSKSRTNMNSIEPGVSSIPIQTIVDVGIKCDRTEIVELLDTTNSTESTNSDVMNDGMIDNRRSNSVHEAGDSNTPVESKIQVPEEKNDPLSPCSNDVPQSPTGETTLEREAASVHEDDSCDVSQEKNETQQKVS